MSLRGRRKRVFLYLISIVLPSALLIAFTLRLIGQDRELAQKRFAEERQRLALDIGRDLLSVLENARKKAAPPFLLAGKIETNGLSWPWDPVSRHGETDGELGDPRFRETFDRAEKIEFASNHPAEAVRRYEGILKANPAPSERQSALVRLSLARSLSKSGLPEEADRIDRLLLALPGTIRDEHDVPFALYAAERLAGRPPGQEAVLKALDPAAFPWELQAPGALIHGREIFHKLETTATGETNRIDAARGRARIIEILAIREQAESLKRDFLSLELKNDGDWVLYGESPWFIGVSASPVGGRILAVFDARKSLDKSLRLDPPRLSPASGISIAGLQESEGLPLGRSFPNARLILPPWSAGGLSNVSDSRSLLLLAIVVLALLIAVTGSALFWRDIRRDLATAEMRSQFVASVTHELKTPLAAIRMFAETLKLGRLGEPEKREEYLETIVNESQRLDRLLTNVLDFSKIEQGKRDYRFEKTSLAAILETASRIMDYPLRQKGFDLRMRAEDGIPEVQADRDALLQAVLNLLDNAMKYSGEAREIELILERKGRTDAAIRVQDHGLGIPESEKQRIFEKFYRVPDSQNAGVTGAGLGLSLAAHIAAAHGGRIDVQSRLGEGSVFSILLPLETAE